MTYEKTISTTEPRIKKTRVSTPKKLPMELISIFWQCPPDAFFNQETISLIINKSVKTLESDRWRRSGIPYRKVGAHVCYQKKDVIDYIMSHDLILPETKGDEQ